MLLHANRFLPEPGQGTLRQNRLFCYKNKKTKTHVVSTSARAAWVSFPLFHATSATAEVSTVRRFFTARGTPGRRRSCRSAKEDLLLEMDLRVCTAAALALGQNPPALPKLWLVFDKGRGFVTKSVRTSMTKNRATVTCSSPQRNKVYVNTTQQPRGCAVRPAPA